MVKSANLRDFDAIAQCWLAVAGDSAPALPQFGPIEHKAASILKRCKLPLPDREQIRCVFATCPPERTPEPTHTIIGRCT